LYDIKEMGGGIRSSAKGGGKVRGGRRKSLKSLTTKARAMHHLGTPGLGWGGPPKKKKGVEIFWNIR